MTTISHDGMTEKELLDLAAERSRNSIGNLEPEYYGIGQELRHYGFYPMNAPLFVSSEHGICLWDYPQNYNLNASYPYMLVHSGRMKNAWQMRSPIPCFIMKSPFAVYRKRRNIQRSADATGTLAFFAHSTKEIDIELDIDNYIRQLSNLPPIYHPVSVCLHYVDIQKGFHKIFLEKSIPVYTAGHWLDPEFMGRFYQILSQFKFAISNMIGSCTFYAVEMGIPFSLHGEIPKYFNRADSSFKLGEWNLIESHQQYSKAWSIFEGLHNTISSEQRSFVEAEMGIHDGISRSKMSFLFYSSLVRSLFTTSFLKHLASIVYNHLPDTVKGRFYLMRNNLSKEVKIHSHLTTNERKYLHKLAKGLNFGSTAVEIGSYHGASTCLIASGIKKKNSLLYCIDTWGNQTMPEGEKDTYGIFCKNTEKYKDVIVPVRGWSSEVVKTLSERIEKIDFLFIDGDHSYQACKADWELYFPFLKKGSIVVFHDTGWAEGVNQVIASSVTKVADRILKLPNLQAYKINTEYKCVN
jgi:predicted O-methyltransferase YrrM